MFEVGLLNTKVLSFLYTDGTTTPISKRTLRRIRSKLGIRLREDNLGA